MVSYVLVDWGTVSLGSLDPYFRSATCSPSNVALDGGCVIASLDSNLQASIWSPTKNRLQGPWKKVVGELRNLIGSSLPPNDPADDTGPVNILQTQVTSLAWSSQPNFSVSPSITKDASVLAVGSRAGNVDLYRYIASESQAELKGLVRIPLGDRWVSLLAWSSWKSSQPGHCHALLACGISDGSISIIRVEQTLFPASSTPELVAGYEDSVVSGALHIKSDVPSGQALTSLRWIETPQMDHILISSTPGQLQLWYSLDYPSASREIRVINLRTIPLSVGSTSLSPITGVSYIPHRDILVISLADGSLHVEGHISKKPSSDVLAPNADLTSESLSATARSICSTMQSDGLIFADVNQINGMVPYDNGSTFAWLHEIVRPKEFDYKHDAKHTSVFVVAQLFQGPTDEDVLEMIARETHSSESGRAIKIAEACI
ncbi:hypothetical protein NLI96_g752 [Meripilus lineatus]|uniref:Transcription factor IIIC 90kDa subunit N-terminal domain-containing protein n=1 Tax=Meripilus lineatus TaxID=2056292 RepID=A0AAD5VBQ8_9APHY|nr:hypothetical protein NLI96_g752 [Physisporinus lineatus]